MCIVLCPVHSETFIQQRTGTEYRAPGEKMLERKHVGAANNIE